MSSDTVRNRCFRCVQPYLVQGQEMVCPICNGSTLASEDLTSRLPGRFGSVISLIEQIGPDSALSGTDGQGSRTGGAYIRNYTVGPVLEELIEQLSMNDQSSSTPAPRSSIDAMPVVEITETHLLEDLHCPVCKERFQSGSEARQMPCNHMYHSECIVPWLVRHNSCPVCRFKLPSHRTRTVSVHSSLNSSSDVNNSSSGEGNGHQIHGWSSSSVRSYVPPRSTTWNSAHSQGSTTWNSAHSQEANYEMDYSGWPFDY